MPTIFDIGDSYLQAGTKVNKWFDGYMNEFLEPLRKLQIAMWWQRLPPEQKLLIQAQMPAEYAEMEKRYGGKNANGQVQQG